MLRIPYTFDQANTLCGNLKHLVDCSFDMHSPIYGNIECVAVSPFDVANKKTFIQNYLLCSDAEKSLKADYNGLLYDVIVIARSKIDYLDIVQEDVTTWMKKNNYTLSGLPFVSANDTQSFSDNAFLQ